MEYFIIWVVVKCNTTGVLFRKEHGIPCILSALFSIALLLHLVSHVTWTWGVHPSSCLLFLMCLKTLQLELYSPSIHKYGWNLNLTWINMIWTKYLNVTDYVSIMSTDQYWVLLWTWLYNWVWSINFCLFSFADLGLFHIGFRNYT